MPFGLVGESLPDQLPDHLDDLGDVLGGPGLQAGPEHAEGSDVIVVGAGEPVCERLDRFAVGVRLPVDLVVDVGDVAGVDDFRVKHLEYPVEHIEDDGRTAVADVYMTVDRRPADIHGDAFRVDGPEDLLAAGKRVVQCQFQVQWFPWSDSGWDVPGSPFGP